MNKKYILIPILCLIVLFYALKITKSQKEGFMPSFNSCRAKGYTKELCNQNPMPGTCLCENGRVGKIVPGFRGECCCDDACLLIN